MDGKQYLALKISREIFTPEALSGQNIVWYKALTVKTNKTTAMLQLITLWMGYVLVTEMTALLTDSLSTADGRTFLRTEQKYGRRKSAE